MGTRTDAIKLLSEVAAWYRRRATGVKMYDPNVGTSGVGWRYTLEARPVALDWFRSQFKTTDAGRKLTLRANDRFIAADVGGEFGLIPFSINRPDGVFGLARRSTFRIGSTSMVLFSNAVDEASALLGKPAVARAIVDLRLRADESVHVCANGLTVYLQPRSRQRILDGVASAIALADRLPAAAASRVDFSDLPKELIPLVPLAKRWGLSDDVDRRDRLSRTSTRSLQSLVRGVAPLFGAVNAYLNSYRSAPMSDSAAALGALAECAAEAQLLLEHRGAAVPNKRLQPTARALRSGARRG